MKCMWKIRWHWHKILSNFMPACIDCIVKTSDRHVYKISIVLLPFYLALKAGDIFQKCQKSIPFLWMENLKCLILWIQHGRKQHIFEKNLNKCVAHASFGTFCVQIGQLFQAQRYLKLSEEFEIDDIFLRKQPFYSFPTFSKDSLCLE